jgi:hypothetical protein
MVPQATHADDPHLLRWSRSVCSKWRVDLYASAYEYGGHLGEHGVKEG